MHNRPAPSSDGPENDIIAKLKHVFFSSLLNMMVPILALLFGCADVNTTLLAIFASFCVVTFIYATAVLVFHMKNTVR